MRWPITGLWSRNSRPRKRPAGLQRAGWRVCRATVGDDLSRGQGTTDRADARRRDEQRHDPRYLKQGRSTRPHTRRIKPAGLGQGVTRRRGKRQHAAVGAKAQRQQALEQFDVPVHLETTAEQISWEPDPDDPDKRLVVLHLQGLYFHSQSHLKICPPR